MTALAFTGPLNIASARLEETDEALALLDDSARWLEANGIRQWHAPTPEQIRAWWRRAVERGQVFLARRASDPRAVGVFRIQWADPELWEEDGGSAGYLYGLAVRPDLHGQRIGEQMLDWAQRYFAESGRRVLRLDCRADNPKLRGYYERLGFVCRGEQPREGYSLALYEREA